MRNTEKSARYRRQQLTAVVLILAAVHLCFPSVNVDLFTLIMIGIAILANFGGVFKALEIGSSGLKVEYQDLKEAAEQAAKAGLLQPATQMTSESSSRKKDEEKPLYLQLANQDPNLALAALRLEIERRLRFLAVRFGISVDRKGLRGLMQELMDRHVLSQYERSVLADLVGTLNNAVHGATIEPNVIDWVVDIGPELLAGLDARIQASQATTVETEGRLTSLDPRRQTSLSVPNSSE